MRSRVVFGLGVGLLVACGGRSADRGDPDRYALGTLDGAWQTQEAGGADRAWWHPEHLATAYTDSHCQDQVDDVSMQRLNEQLTGGFTDAVEVSSERIRLDGREGWVRRLTGGLDGVTVEVAAVVIRKDDCVYDMVLIAPPGRFEAAWESWEPAVQGFRVGR